MAEQQEQSPEVDEPNRPEYKVPAKVSVQEIHDKDKDDESLQKYKETLLGDTAKRYPTDKCFIVRKMEIKFEGADKDRESMMLNLEDEENLKKWSFTAKEGAQYRIIIHFDVQMEIVSGLRLVNVVTRKGLTVDKDSFVMGSYGPNKDPANHQVFRTPIDDFPTGMLARGEYKVKSAFVDDDKIEYYKWEWTFKLKKDWKDE